MNTMPDDSDSRRSSTYPVSDARSTSETVVDAVTDAIDRPQEKLRPLYEVVDPDALNSLFAHADAGDSGTTVTFSYEGCRVTVTEREVVVEPETN